MSYSQGNIMGSKATLRINIGFYVEILLWALQKTSQDPCLLVSLELLTVAFWSFLVPGIAEQDGRPFRGRPEGYKRFRAASTHAQRYMHAERSLSKKTKTR